VNDLLIKWGLRFADAKDEAAFWAEQSKGGLRRQQVLAGFGFLVFLVYAVRDVLIGPANGWTPLYIRVFFLLPVLGAAFAMSFVEDFKKYYRDVATATIVAVILATGMITFFYHYEPGGPEQANRTMTSLMLIVLVMTVSGIGFVRAVGVGLLTIAFWFVGSIAKSLPASLYAVFLLNVLTAFGIGTLGAYWLERAERAAFAARGEMRRERERSQTALFAAMPRHVVERIARNERPIAEPFVEAVVVLADLAGFNTLARRIGPKETVRVLDHVFSAFDELGDKHNLERVRTVGDSYMAVGGAYEGAHGEAADAARMAQEMISVVAEAAKRFDFPLGVRVGVHVGPLIGGVVGQTSPIYDFWGDTLNVVNDLEASGEVGKIHCSEPFYWRLGEAWRFEERGPREFRGVGTLRTFYLLGPAEAETIPADGA
jgi:class 3 adenylate cyclase